MKFVVVLWLLCYGPISPPVHQPQLIIVKPSFYFKIQTTLVEANYDEFWINTESNNCEAIIIDSKKELKNKKAKEGHIDAITDIIVYDVTTSILDSVLRIGDASRGILARGCHLYL